jgi:DNA-binding MarR family transcriptional regulator
VSDVLQDSPAISPTINGADLPVTSESQQVPATRHGLRVLQALRQIIREVDLYSRHLLREYEITGPQLITLLTVKEYELVTVSAIARHIYLSPSTVIGILDRLEAKGLIRRDRDLKDRRLVHVSLTEQGKALARNAPSPLQDAFAGAMRKLPETELVMIAESLERIVGLMQLQHMDTAPILESEPIDAAL